MKFNEMTKEELLAEAKKNKVKVHHNANIDTIKAALLEHEESLLAEASAEKDLPKNVKVVEPKLTRDQKAMRLVRIIVTPNDPLLHSYPGLIFTVGSSSVNKGRVIKKFVPFNNEAGWHVPHIIYEQIKNAEMQKFKPHKLANGETVMVPYITKKFTVEVLPDLTKEELKKLADQQKARGDA